jgi:hypothetical protein
MVFGWEDAPIRVTSGEIYAKSLELAEKGEMWDANWLKSEDDRTQWRYGW